MQQIIDFILELEKLKGVTRKTRPLGLDRYENSAEHSWQLALLAISLERFAASPVDMNHVVRMLLVHDIAKLIPETQSFLQREAGKSAKPLNSMP